MGVVCSGPAVITPYTKNSQILTTLQSKKFSTLYTISERILSDTPSIQIRLCKQTSSNKIYVLKILKSSTTSLEPQILKTLNHAKIIKFIQSFSNPLQTLIILEYSPFGDLGQYLMKSGKVTENLALSIIYQVLLGLSYLHSFGIYHRDIKPENIFINSISDTGIECKIGDFDSAGYIRSRDKEPYGTLPYMAPEIFDQKYDEKVDVWSCGVLLFKLITGHLLFYGKNPEEIELKIRTANLSFPSFLSKPVKDLLLSLLTRDPSARIKAHQALLHPCLLPINELSENNNITINT